jgi:hypothetical protein
MRESIKLLLNNGVSFSIAYKSEINDWYSDFKLFKVWDRYKKKEIYYSMIEGGHKQFDDIDEAVDYFMEMCFSSKNKGLIQERLDKKIDFENDERYDLEKPSEELTELFEIEGKIVDEEYKLMK